MPVAGFSEFATATTGVALVPPVARSIAADSVIQRVRFHPGRPLTAAALRLDSANAEARMGLTCRALADGIVEGLQVSLSDQTADPGGFSIAAGLAVTPSGQDIAVNRIVRMRVGALPRLNGLAPGGAVPPTPEGIGVLVAEAVAAEETRFTADADRAAAFRRDQQLDPGTAPYQDARILDGLRVSLVVLSGLPPALSRAEAVAQAVAALIAAEETGAPVARYLQSGIGLALVAVDAAGAILWSHRNGAARHGGGVAAPLVRSPIAGSVPPRLRQSRVDAFLEAVAAQVRADPARAFDPAAFTTLPPAGVVPAPGGARPRLFPPRYRETVAPVPMRQLDAVLAAAEALAPFDLSVPDDEVRWYVPVPDHLYEPDLLLRPSVHGRFVQAVTNFRSRVAERLAARDALRAQAPVVEGRIDTDAVPVFDTDPDAIPGETGFTAERPTALPPFEAEARAAHAAWVTTVSRGLLTDEQFGTLDTTPGTGDARRGIQPFLQALTAGIDSADDFVDFGFTRVQADIYRLRQTILDNEEATKLATFPVLAGIAKGTNALASNRGLAEHFVNIRSTGSGGGGGGGSDSAASRPAAEVERAAAASDAPVLAMRLDDGFLGRETMDMISGGGMTILPRSEGSGVRFLAGGSDDPRGSTAIAAIAAAGGIGAVSGAGRGSVTDFGIGIGIGVGGVRPEFVGGAGSGTVTVGAGEGIGVGTGIGVTPDRQTILAASQRQTAYLDTFQAGRRFAIDEIAFANSIEKRAGIAYAAAIPGDYQDVRTLTIASRLQDPAALAARTSALRIKADALSAVTALGISMLGVKAPIVSITASVAVLSRSDFDRLVTPLDAAAETRPLAAALRAASRVIDDAREAADDVLLVDFETLTDAQRAAAGPLLDRMRRWFAPVAAEGLPAAALARSLDPDPSLPADEGDYLGSAVAVLESVVSVYRATERRIATLRRLSDGARATLATLVAIARRWREALEAADRDLAEARHDLRSAEALLSEETARVTALEAQRRAVLRDNVKVMAYARIRRLRPHSAGLTSGRLLPGLFQDPLPAVLARPVKLPEDLGRIVAVLRDVPLDWLADRAALTADFDDPDILDTTFHWAAHAAAIRFNAQSTGAAFARSAAPAAGGSATRSAGQGTSRGRAKATAATIASSYAAMSQQFLLTRASMDVAAFRRQSWRERRRRAEAELSLNDILDSGRNPAAARRALDALEALDRVTGALHARLRQAPAAARLLWAEALSAYDGDPVMTRITTLPGWFGLDTALRDEIQSLHAWLFARIDRAVPEAVAMMSDIVQVAVLLAANAETDTIVRARIAAQKTVSGGDAVDLVLDRGAPPIGSTVWFGPVGPERFRGRVDNIAGTTLRILVDPGMAMRRTIGPATQVFVDSAPVSPYRHGR